MASNTRDNRTMDKKAIRGLRSIPLDESQRSLLVQRRKEYGLSQQALADRIGVMQVTVHAIEVGKHQPSADVLGKLCEELGLAYDVSVFVFLRPKSKRGRRQREK
jgi:transcriptional regulator with XRE-family HTH domain